MEATGRRLPACDESQSAFPARDPPRHARGRQVDAQNRNAAGRSRGGATSDTPRIGRSCSRSSARAAWLRADPPRHAASFDRSELAVTAPAGQPERFFLRSVTYPAPLPNERDMAAFDAVMG